jgi:hypothetical protein
MTTRWIDTMAIAINERQRHATGHPGYGYWAKEMD